MPYRLSPAKLSTYQACPAQYQFRYEFKLPGFGFGGAGLGRSLHGALTRIYRDWDYSASPKPDLSWLDACWQLESQANGSLTEAQVSEGYEILARYFQNWIAPLDRFLKPLMVEGKVQGRWQVDDLEFVLSGRVDRLDWFDVDSLALVEYKTSRKFVEPAIADLTLQVGLYALAINQQWERELKSVTLIFLRPGESVTVDVTDEQLAIVQQTITDLAMRLRAEQRWEPTPGDHCDRCKYQQYCPAQTDQPMPIPDQRSATSVLQLSLRL